MLTLLCFAVALLLPSLPLTSSFKVPTPYPIRCSDLATFTPLHRPTHRHRYLPRTMTTPSISRGPSKTTSTMVFRTNGGAAVPEDQYPSSLPDEMEWQTVLSAFKTYSSINGNLLIPAVFVVPSSPPWPESTWGLRLGSRVGMIRSRGRYVDTIVVDGGIEGGRRRQILEDLGFQVILRQ